MLKIKNNDIYLTRGENATVSLEVCNTDGTPFILPPVSGRLLPAIASISEIDDRTLYSFNTPLIGVDESVTFVTEADCELEVQVIRADNSVSIVQLATVNKTVALAGIKGVISVATTGKLVYVDFMQHRYFVDTDKPVSVLAITVRAAAYGAVVLEKYLNLHSGIMQNGETDYSVYGWNKFTSQYIPSYAGDAPLLEALIEFEEAGITFVGESSGVYYQLAKNLDGTYALWPYIFAVDIPLSHEDTEALQEGEYTYDIIVYQGIVSDFDKDGFPFDEVLWKRQIVSPHKFVVGGSNNA